MLRHVLFDLQLFVNEDDRPNSQKRILWLLEALTRCDQLYLQLNPDTPLIYQSGIVYKNPQQYEPVMVPEAAKIQAYLDKSGAPASVQAALRTLAQMTGSGEVFRDIPRIIENGGGDCDNVASWRCAELRERLGVNAQPYITWRQRPDGGYTYHVIVRWPDGSSEDPSLLLGMGGENRATDRAEEERKLGERIANYINAFKLGGHKAAEEVLARGASDDAAEEVLGLAGRRKFLTDNWNETMTNSRSPRQGSVNLFGSARLRRRLG